MMRFVTTALFALTATAAVAQTPSLRSTILVSSDLVRIGDLVEYAAPGKAQIAVFRAPDLGETGSVSVSRVLEALRPHDMIGVDVNGLTEISVTRASRVIGSGEIKSRIAEIAAERLRIADAATIAVIFDTPPQTMHLDPGNSTPLTPVRMTIDPRSGRFDAMFRPDGAPAIRLTGVAQETHEAVVLTRTLARGDIVRESDVMVERRPKAEVQSDTLRDPALVVGMATQQALRAGQPIRSTDLAKPHLAKRGDTVVLQYEVPGIVLTARGKAEESGALGDVINVLNVQSKRIVQGTVTGPGQVTVTSLTPRTTASPVASVQRVSALDAGRSKAE